jgi:hypothetical protein
MSWNPQKIIEKYIFKAYDFESMHNTKLQHERNPRKIIEKDECESTQNTKFKHESKS